MTEPDDRRIDAEFPALADLLRTDRRAVLKVMAASMALAGLPGCGPAPETVAARGRGVPGHTPGAPLVFATSLTLDGYGTGVLVRSDEGHPTKIEGNPLHPASLGATDAFTQAGILTFHDPDRSRAARLDGQPQPAQRFERALAQVADEVTARGGEGLRILTGPTSSPSLAGLLADLLGRLPNARWHQHAPLGPDNRREGARLVFGDALETRHDLVRASVIVTLDADILGPGPHQVAYARGFAAGRREPEAGPKTNMNRLYAIESTPGATGARADRRLALPPSAIAAFAHRLAVRLGVAEGEAGSDPLLDTMAADLRVAGPGALVVAGRHLPAETHALAHAVNHALGAVGTTVHHTGPVLAGPWDESASLEVLAADMAAGAVSHLVILDSNPAYTAPGDLGFADLLATVPFTLHLGLWADETAALCRWHAPMAHALESWGDARAWDGTVGLMQPVAAPRHGRRTPQEVAAALAGRPAAARELVRERFQGDDAAWRQALHDGVVPDTALPSRAVAPAPGWRPAPPPAGAGGLEVVFAPDPSVWDGCFANNAWLQELPKPLSKMVWDNAILLAPATAAALDLENGAVAALTLGSRTLRGPVWTLPGHAADTVTLPLGYGRWSAGRVGTAVGFDAYRLRRADAPWLAAGAELRATGERHALATTQRHATMAGRDIVRTAPPVPREPPAQEPPPSIYPDYAYAGPAWGMAVDLNACVGCNACVTACQAENNVPVVGRAEVARGREMHWLRIDRYFEDQQTLFQPMLCMHCEKAPCEVVCPVNATVHDAEGLNVMVYNRCVGTRYCSNNCPYKVRRFNWFDYAQDDGVPAEAANPEVTVRVRGVMEKCTYCIQRIATARIRAKLENRPIADGEVVTACQQVCPSGAIVFGDVNDPDSAVSRRKRSPRNYALLGELNTRPRTTYLARIDNPPAGEEA
ncbi:MAG TPA: 4Fe-4S dicluster domain-containing protein [Azospirillum sp.]|nr:4Fe-4S dicluster domain-containing protein [Azospirillum sp.]